VNGPGLARAGRDPKFAEGLYTTVGCQTSLSAYQHGTRGEAYVRGSRQMHDQPDHKRTSSDQSPIVEAD
jgi:hypothetical protein